VESKSEQCFAKVIAIEPVDLPSVLVKSVQTLALQPVVLSF